MSTKRTAAKTQVTDSGAELRKIGDWALAWRLRFGASHSDEQRDRLIVDLLTSEVRLSEAVALLSEIGHSKQEARSGASVSLYTARIYSNSSNLRPGTVGQPWSVENVSGRLLSAPCLRGNERAQ
jgi:hypothetical protein